MTKGLGNDQDFFWGEGGIIVNNLSSKSIYHKKCLSVKWFQNEFKIVINLFGETA